MGQANFMAPRAHGGGVEAFPGHLETQNKRRGPQVGSIGEHFHLFDPSKLRLFTYQIDATNLRHYVLYFFSFTVPLRGHCALSTVHRMVQASSLGT